MGKVCNALFFDIKTKKRRKLAKEFNETEETIRNYFGGANYEKGKFVGIHTETGGNDGEFVVLDDCKIYNRTKV